MLVGQSRTIQSDRYATARGTGLRNRNGKRSSNNSDRLLLRVALPNPHTLRVDPKDLRIDFPTLNSAVVTFHLTDANRPRRRMLVVAKNAAGWKITHLNKSDIAVR